MLFYTAPGFLLAKTKAVSSDSIPSISKILLFVCQPAFSLYAFNEVDFSWSFLGTVGMFMAIIVSVQFVILFVFSFIYKKKWTETKYRIATIASCFGNCVFFGAPVLSVLMPHFPEAIVFANGYAVAMNLLAWTVGSAIITNDKKFVSIKKVLLNPATIGFACALLYYIAGGLLDFAFPAKLSDAIALLGKMSTPVSMIILGMRLATVRIKPIFTTPLFYFTIFFKQMVYPLIGAFTVSLVPIMTRDICITAFILCACPVASIVLNFAEMLCDGQEAAADLFILGTLSSIVTMPVILLLV